MQKKNITKSLIGLGVIAVTALLLLNQNSVGDTTASTESENVRKSQKLMNLIQQQKQENAPNEKIEKDAANNISQPVQPANKDVATGQTATVAVPDSLVLEKTQNFFAQIPRTYKLEGKTNADVHDIPAVVIEAGERLAEIRQFFVENPQPLAIETAFYLECTQQKDFFESIKAICAARVGELYTKKTGRKISPLVFDKRTAVLKDKINL